jgi:hypothetical protein
VFDRFTEHARKAMGHSRQAAQRYTHDYIAPEHILLGLLDVDCVAADVLDALDVPRADLVASVVSGLTHGTGMVMTGSIPFTPAAKTVLERALEESVGFRHNHIGTEHLLLGLLRDEGLAGTALRKAAPELDRVRAAVLDRVGIGRPRDCRALVLASNRGPVDEVIRPTLAEAEITRIEVVDPETCDGGALDGQCRLADFVVLVAPAQPGLVFAAGLCRGARTPTILFSDPAGEIPGPLASLRVVSTAEELRDILQPKEP